MDKLERFSNYETCFSDSEDTLLESSDISTDDIEMILSRDLDPEVKILIKAFYNYFENMSQENNQVESATRQLLQNMLHDNDVAQQIISGIAYLQNKPLLLQYFLTNVIEFIKIVWKIALKNSAPAISAKVRTKSETTCDVTAVVTVKTMDPETENVVAKCLVPAYNMGKKQIVILIEDFIEHLEESTQSNQFEIPITPELEANCNDDEVIRFIVREIPYLKDKPTLREYFQNHIEFFVKILSGARDVEVLVEAENDQANLLQKTVRNGQTSNDTKDHSPDLAKSNTSSKNASAECQKIQNIEFALELLSSIGFTDREENLMVLQNSGSVSVAAIRLCEIHKNAFAIP
ncbi:uncharacterized protein LOC119689547 isoform X2 [Teleopsis dalmanni]|uniref:uncharacterized protein LOC119689547 isoform X2 n=1 Tax=Teleopsis dalmanni TaxID=139649 RepID=UPI0018CF2C8A|nr:uncharacterized protein LOC119689547 isoform X2 [Teleopsis dalmanni]